MKDVVVCGSLRMLDAGGEDFSCIVMSFHIV